jgi:hypothetical protein
MGNNWSKVSRKEMKRKDVGWVESQREGVRRFKMKKLKFKVIFSGVRLCCFLLICFYAQDKKVNLFA